MPLLCARIVAVQGNCYQPLPTFLSSIYSLKTGKVRSEMNHFLCLLPTFRVTELNFAKENLIKYHGTERKVCCMIGIPLVILMWKLCKHFVNFLLIPLTVYNLIHIDIWIFNTIVIQTFSVVSSTEHSSSGSLLVFKTNKTNTSNRRLVLSSGFLRGSISRACQHGSRRDVSRRRRRRRWEEEMDSTDSPTSSYTFHRRIKTAGESLLTETPNVSKKRG